MANQKFKSKGIFFLDCPVSGGPARALAGELTMMASGDKECMEKAQQILDVLGSDVHIIEGGAGAGSTVKCVHQLLAGVHICAAAEAMGKLGPHVHGHRGFASFLTYPRAIILFQPWAPRQESTSNSCIV